MQLFFQNLSAGMEFLPRLSLTGIIEICIISWMTYAFLTWVMDTKAWILLRGLLLIVAFVGFCTLFHLDTILWLLGQITTIAVTALIIIFQPELRSALEQLGNRNILSFLNGLMGESGSASSFTEHTVNELVRASFEMGKVKTGALMVIEQKISLNDIVRTGIDIDGIVSNQLLIHCLGDLLSAAFRQHANFEGSRNPAPRGHRRQRGDRCRDDRGIRGDRTRQCCAGRETRGHGNARGPARAPLIADCV